MIFDLSRIAANNGWAMAFTGAILVLSGLSILALIISQLHKIIGFFEKQAKGLPVEEIKPAPVSHADLLNDLEATVTLYQSLTAGLGERFDLAQLYRLAHKDQLPHPHLSLRTLRENGFLIASGDGTFSWKNA